MTSIAETSEMTYQSEGNADIMHTLMTDLIEDPDEVVPVKKKSFKRPVFEKLNSFIYTHLRQGSIRGVQLRSKKISRESSFLGKNASIISSDSASPQIKISNSLMKKKSTLKRSTISKGSSFGQEPYFAYLDKIDKERSFSPPKHATDFSEFHNIKKQIQLHQRHASMTPDVETLI